MRSRLIAAVPAFAAALVFAPLAGADEFRWQGAVASGKSIEIKNVNGSIEAVPSTGREVVVTATKRARRSDPESVRIETVEHAGGVTVCAVYPSGGEQANECGPARSGRMSTRDNDVVVEFRVEVPAGVNLVAKTVNGGIEAEGLGADIEARTVNGSIKATGAGDVEAETVNGSIEARMGRADWTGTHEYKTVNGSIVLGLPGDFSADVKAATVNGEIETDFPLTVSGRFSSKRLSGRVGDGGRMLELETVNGAIRLRKN